MGWSFTNKREGVSTKEFFKEEFIMDNEKNVGRVLDCKIRKGVAYVAYEIKNKITNEIKVTAIVCILSYRGDEQYNFGYKDMTEDMHPYYYNCSKSILKLLTKTDNEMAQCWRKECLKAVGEVDNPNLLT